MTKQPEAHEAQVCLVVPSDAKPGETKLSVHIPAIGGKKDVYTALQVQLPAMIQPGQTMVLTKLKEEWSIGLAKYALPDSIVVEIPSDAVPGETFLPVLHKGLEVTRALVPLRAKPGLDELQVVRPSDPSEPWNVILCYDPDYPELVRDMATGAAQASLRVPPMEANLAYQRLVEAVRSAGGYVNPKMTRGCAPPLNIPGIIAVEDIAVGEVICKIPKALHCSPATAEAYAPDTWRRVQPPGLGKRTEEAALFAFVARLLHEAEERAVLRKADPSAEPSPQTAWLEGADSKVRRVYEAYMDQLLGEDFTHHPMRRVGEDQQAMKELLNPSRSDVHMYKEAKCIHTLYRIVANTPGASDLLGGPNFRSGMFFRAMLNFQSRQFKAAVSRSLVPVADLLNHAPASEMGVAWGYDAVAQAHVLTCVRAKRAGEELLQSYGHHPNACFYRCYNFTMPPQREIVWCYSAWKDEVPDIFASFVPATSAFNSSEVHLNSGELSESVREVLREIAENGGNPAFFLRLLCSQCIQPFEESMSLRPVLESLKTARANDPCSSDWWAHLEGGDKALADSDLVRIQMCEYLCLVTFLETICVISGELPEDKCLEKAYVLRTQLRDYIFQLHEKHHFT